ncbi:MAG TPA: hypothetical protein VGE98_13050, partial [Thermoanaerobaculia bacterium]
VLASELVRTTLDIADDVLIAIEEKARRQKRSAGDLLSELAREALMRHREDSEVREPQGVYGFDPLPHRGRPVSNDLIDKLRDEDSD